MKKLLQNKQLNLIVKLLVVVLLCWVIYRQVFAKENATEIWNTFLTQLNIQNIHWLILTIILIPINWTFETLKWQALVKNFENLSFWKCYKAILAGVTFSIFTPNRIGEYGGRILLVKPENNWKGVIATLVGSFSQLIILMSFGIVGLLFFVLNFFEIDTWIWTSVLFLGIFLSGLMLFCFYNVDLVVPIVKRLPYAQKLKPFVKHVRVLQNYSARTLSIALVFAFARYLTYSLQYFFLLQFFGIKVSIINGIAGIATIFLLQTSIPLPPLWGLFVRGKIALDIWGLFSENELGILASTFSLWTLNLIVPALIGTVFIIQINVVQSLGIHEEKEK